ncbi:MAG: hypothetical protein VKK80_15650 [Prochlorothrix sp.]|nr:hypothetical protein [Prochlorothrix sp.]
MSQRPRELPKTLVLRLKSLKSHQGAIGELDVQRSLDRPETPSAQTG